MARIADQLGMPLLPWQRLVADVALEIDPRTDRLAYRDVVVTVPRQSGKTTLILALWVWRCLVFEAQVASYAAQTHMDARKKLLDDQLPVLQRSPFARHFSVRKQLSAEAVIWPRTGSRLVLTSTTDKAGHGSTLDLGFVDEAFSQPDSRIEQAYKPAMITRPQPQMWVVSTAGTDASVYLNGKVRRGREASVSGRGRGLAYFEWSADPEADPADPATWRACMPALGLTVTEQAVRDDLDAMDDVEDFRRAYLNIPTRARRDESVFANWADLLDSGSRVPGDVSWALDMPPDLSSVAVGVSGRRSDGLMHLELAAQLSRRRVVDWLRGRTRSVALDGRSPAAALTESLAAAGIAVAELRTSEFCDACESLYDAASESALRHIGQAPLSAAAAAVRWRSIGERRAFSRRDATDISPLVAVAIAHRAASSPKRRPTVW